MGLGRRHGNRLTFGSARRKFRLRDEPEYPAQFGRSFAAPEAPNFCPFQISTGIVEFYPGCTSYCLR